MRALRVLRASPFEPVSYTHLERLPRQCAAIEDELAAIARLEQANAPAPDEAARCFGHLMGELFVVEQDLSLIHI